MSSNEIKCRLCNRRTADQTGSHITSAFLLTSQIGKRGEEKAYLLTTNPDQDYSENKGDTGIKEDFMFCRDCEKRLGFVESYYSAEITHKIEEERFQQNFPATGSKHGAIVSCSRIDPIAFALLIYSNIWRASLSTNQLYNHFKLPQHIEENLAFLLDLFLPETVNHRITINLDQWLRVVRECVSFFTFYPFIVIKAEKLDDKTMTFQYFDNVSQQPNHTIINEYIILPFFGNTEWKDDFFEFKDEMTYQDVVNDKYEPSKIAIITNERYLRVRSKIEGLAVRQRRALITQGCVAELRRRGIPVTFTNLILCRDAKIAQIRMR